MSKISTGSNDGTTKSKIESLESFESLSKSISDFSSSQVASKSAYSLIEIRSDKLIKFYFTYYVTLLKAVLNRIFEPVRFEKFGIQKPFECFS